MAVPSSLKAVAEAVEKDKMIFVVAQKSSDIEDPQSKDLYTHGTIAKIIQNFEIAKQSPKSSCRRYNSR